jgi:hypothetical protein
MGWKQATGGGGRTVVTPTLLGRIQTRIVLLCTVALLWTLVAMPFIPRTTQLGSAYLAGFVALALTGLLGMVVWEPLYHFLQQFRWEKDWPALFGFVTFLPEGLVLHAVLRATVLADAPPFASITFWVHFFTTWLVMWLFANGAMRVFSLRWRYRGGRVF